MAIEIGHVEAILRYPLKSMAGERLEAARLGSHDPEDDRHRAGAPTAIRAFAMAWLLIALACGIEPAAAAPQWQSLPGAPVSVRMDDLCFIAPDTGWVCTGEGRIYHTTDAGASWELQHDDPNLYFRCIRFADSQRGWAGTLNTEALMFQTVNGGEDWTPVTNLPEPRPSAICGMSVPASHLIYAVGSYFGPARVLKSSDGGATWAAMDLAPLASTLIDVQFRSPLEGFAVGSIGTFPYENRAVVMHTGDGGANWDRRFLGDRDGEWGWKISFPTPSVGYVSLERENPPMFFLKTTDAGSNWTELPFVDHNEQGIGFVTPEIGWIGGAGNPTFGTTDGGANWTLTPWGYYLNRFQFLSTSLGYGSGVTVYKYSDGLVSVPDAIPPKPRSFAAPNPFENRTTIRFVLAKPASVQLYVVDPSGRVVRTLEKGSRAAGTHVVTWDGTSDRGELAPAGIYLYVLRAGERHEMGKLVRVR